MPLLQTQGRKLRRSKETNEGKRSETKPVLLHSAWGSEPLPQPPAPRGWLLERWFSTNQSCHSDFLPLWLPLWCRHLKPLGLLIIVSLYTCCFTTSGLLSLLHWMTNSFFKVPSGVSQRGFCKCHTTYTLTQNSKHSKYVLHIWRTTIYCLCISKYQEKG